MEQRKKSLDISVELIINFFKQKKPFRVKINEEFWHQLGGYFGMKIQIL